MAKPPAFPAVTTIRNVAAECRERLLASLEEWKGVQQVELDSGQARASSSFMTSRSTKRITPLSSARGISEVVKAAARNAPEVVPASESGA